jgi:exodeoxyribonuclease VII large subunit
LIYNLLPAFNKSMRLDWDFVDKMQNKVKIYTVSQVNSLIKEILENNLPGHLTITGEITDWKLHYSGHCYFLLKDESSQLPCVMWKSSFSKVKFKPENGLAVIAQGNIDVYPPQGKYQFYVESMTPAGIGALQLAFEQMVKKLRAQGFFDDAHKRAIPVYPERIGILTSESGAAVHDIIDSIFNRWPCVRLFLYPVPVQGEGAAEQIAAAIRDLNRRNQELKLDVLIVGRGGGSLEDLWAFNEEVLARAIYDSKIPIISAVGHEVDVTIADLVADKRASTPTKAGVVAVPDIRDVLAALSNRQRLLTNDIKRLLQTASGELRTVLASAVFRNPLLPVRSREQRLDELAASVVETIKDLLMIARENLHAAYEQVIKIEPHRLLAKKAVELNKIRSRAIAAEVAMLSSRRMQLTARENRLAGLNPKSVLHRGYSITKAKKSGQLLRNLQDVQVGDLLITELAEENLIESQVTKK